MRQKIKILPLLTLHRWLNLENGTLQMHFLWLYFAKAVTVQNKLVMKIRNWSWKCWWNNQSCSWQAVDHPQLVLCFIKTVLQLRTLQKIVIMCKFKTRLKKLISIWCLCQWQWNQKKYFNERFLTAKLVQRKRTIKCTKNSIFFPIIFWTFLCW